jgi:dTDP-4-amino-4,6-dideoxygalactose transaminase
MPVIRFNGLERSYLRQRAELDAAWSRVASSGWYVGGPEVSGFEEAFAAFAGARFAVGVANGTDAIALALMGLGLRPGDRVVVPALSAYPTTVGVVQARATPLFVDVGPDGLIDPDAVAQVLEGDEQVRAVVAVHLFGNCADMHALRAVCSRFPGLRLIEDAAQGHGAMRRGEQAGTWGDAAAWSFYPTKNLGALGDAGAITCNDGDLCERLQRLRNYGQKTRYEHVELGFNSRLDPLQAALLAVKLKSLEAENQRRRSIGSRYDAGLKPVRDRVEPLAPPPDSVPNRHLYPVLLSSTEARTSLQGHLQAAGVETLIHYPIAMPDQAASDPAWSRQRDFSRARSICSRVLSLPIYPDITDEEVEIVIAAVRSWLPSTRAR